jgi:sarcosine oxidase
LGPIFAKNVIIAGNAYSTAGINKVTSATVPLELVLGQFDLSAAANAAILPGNIPFSDTHKDMWFFRKTPEGRLITGMFPLYRVNAAFLQGQLRERVRRTFSARPGQLTHLWAGRVGLTPQGLPTVQTFGPSVLSWTGCNGRGIALAFLMGRALATALTAPEQLPLPITRHFSLHGRALMAWACKAAIAMDRRKRAVLLNL